MLTIIIFFLSIISTCISGAICNHYQYPLRAMFPSHVSPCPSGFHPPHLSNFAWVEIPRCVSITCYWPRGSPNSIGSLGAYFPRPPSPHYPLNPFRIIYFSSQSVFILLSFSTEKISRDNPFYRVSYSIKIKHETASYIYFSFKMWQNPLFIFHFLLIFSYK